MAARGTYIPGEGSSATRTIQQGRAPMSKYALGPGDPQHGYMTQATLDRDRGLEVDSSDPGKPVGKQSGQEDSSEPAYIQGMKDSLVGSVKV